MAMALRSSGTIVPRVYKMCGAGNVGQHFRIAGPTEHEQLHSVLGDPVALGVDIDLSESAGEIGARASRRSAARLAIRPRTRRGWPPLSRNVASSAAVNFGPRPGTRLSASRSRISGAIESGMNRLRVDARQCNIENHASHARLRDLFVR